MESDFVEFRFKKPARDELNRSGGDLHIAKNRVVGQVNQSVTREIAGDRKGRDVEQRDDLSWPPLRLRESIRAWKTAYGLPPESIATSTFHVRVIGLPSTTVFAAKTVVRLDGATADASDRLAPDSVPLELK